MPGKLFVGKHPTLFCCPKIAEPLPNGIRFIWLSGYPLVSDKNWTGEERGCGINGDLLRRYRHSDSFTYLEFAPFALSLSSMDIIHLGFPRPRGRGVPYTFVFRCRGLLVTLAPHRLRRVACVAIATGLIPIVLTPLPNSLMRNPCRSR